MTPVEVLRGTREKLAQGWTKGATARDCNGKPVSPTEPTAACWCVYGAAIAAGASLDERLLAYTFLRKVNGGIAVDAFNDTTKHQEVILEWITLAIGVAESEAA